jgi:hypothetical protein
MKKPGKYKKNALFGVAETGKTTSTAYSRNYRRIRTRHQTANDGNI